MKNNDNELQRTTTKGKVEVHDSEDEAVVHHEVDDRVLKQHDATAIWISYPASHHIDGPVNDGWAVSQECNHQGLDQAVLLLEQGHVTQDVPFLPPLTDFLDKLISWKYNSIFQLIAWTVPGLSHALLAGIKQYKEETVR